MFDASKYTCVRCEEEPELEKQLYAELNDLATLWRYSGLKKGDRVIEVHETAVASGAGTPNLRWVPIITVTEYTITRVNQKTYGFAHSGGFRTCYSGKMLIGYECWHARNTGDGWRDNQKVYVIPA